MDDSFGPRLFGHFDFTLLFEHSMLEVLPAAIIIFATPFYVYKACRSAAPCARAGFLLWAKLAVATALGGLQVANTILWWKLPLDSTLARAASTMSCFAAICTGLILYISHLYFTRSPSFLNLFLTVTLLFDAVMTRTYFNRTGLDVLARLHIPIPILKFALVLLEETSKRSLMAEEVRSSLGRETVAGFWNKSLFLWINSTLLVGFRQVLSKDDLSSLDPQFDAELLQGDFASQWAKVDHNSDTALLKACFLAIPWLFISIILPRSLSICFNYAQPFLLQEVVHNVGLQHPTTDVVNGLICATVLVYGGRAVSSAWYRYIKNQITLCIRAILVGAIYQKTLKLSAEELAQSAAITLMSTDVNAVELLISLSYESWARLGEIAAGISILGRFIGPSCVFTLVPAILVSVISAHLSKKMSKTRTRWNEHIQSRVADTSNALAQIKDIKMLGLAPIMAKHLQEKHRAEIVASMPDRATWSVTLALAAFVETVTPTIVVAATLFWTRSSTGLSAPEFFSILALVGMVTNPLSALLGNLGYWSAGFASLARIQAYLVLEEREDVRTYLEEPEEPRSRAAMATGSSSYITSRGLRHNQSRGGNRRALFAVAMYNVAVTLDMSAPILRDIQLTIASNMKTMVFGAVGCGKSTFLKTLLGEVPIREGTICLATDSIAYCSQVPWIRKTTIKLNIIGPNVYNDTWFRRVIWICALDVDLASFPDGIETLVGSEGCNLSGGQKHRIALARALYAKTEMLLLDDIFSSLDMETSSTVRIRLFSQSAVLRNNSTTLIMTTSTAAHLVDADVVIGITRDGRAMELSNRRREVSPTNFPPSVLPSPDDDDPVVIVDEISDEKTGLPSVKPSTKEDEAGKEQPTSKYGDLSLYSYFLRPAGVSRLVLWAIVVSVAAVAERMPQIYVHIWLDKDPDDRLYYTGYALLGVASPLCNLLAGGFYFYLINPKTAEALHWKLTNTTLNATLDFLTGEDAGSLLNRFSQDMSTTSQRLPLAFMPTCWMAVTVLVDIGIIASGASYAAPIMPLFILLLAIIQHFYLQTSRQLRFMELDSSKHLYRHFTETSKGIECVRTMQWEPHFAMDFYAILTETQRPFYYLLTIQQWLQLVLNMASMASAVALVSLALNFTSTTSQSSMGLAMLSLITFSDTTGIFVAAWVDTETGLGAVSRIRTFEQETPQEQDKPRAPQVPQKWPTTGKVDFNCVTSRYQYVQQAFLCCLRVPNALADILETRAQSETPRAAITNVTIRIKAGEKIGISGRTGSGKSSVLVSLLALLEYSGSISIDDREIRSVPRDTLRARITTITQSGIELRGSVRFNLNPFGDESVTDETLTSTLHRVGLLQLIQLRGGLDIDMGKTKLSQGQKQLFQLARALVHKQSTESKLVLVDEGSASMDEGTERRVQTIMDKEFAECTMFIVSHRPIAFDNIDALLRLENGKAKLYRFDQETGDVFAAF